MFITDDGSQLYPAMSVISDEHKSLLNISLWKIDIDIKWNQPEANNLAFREIKTDCVIRSDIDHYFNELDFEKILNKIECNQLDLKSNLYKPQRYVKEKKIHLHPNVYIISKNKYWDINGYNEYFSGNYGYDDVEFMRRADKMLNKVVLTDTKLQSIPDGGTDMHRDNRCNSIKLKEIKLPHLLFRNESKYIMQL